MKQLPQDFLNKIAIICGGSKGIGKAAAIELVNRGCSIVIVARNRKFLDEAAQQASEKKINGQQYIEVFECDTTDFDKLKLFMDDFVANRGVPDYLFNSVGYAKPMYVEQHTPEDFRRNMDVNYFGQLYPTLALLPHMMKAKKGHIIHTSSVMGYMGIMAYASYAPTKYAIVGLSEVLRHELKPYNIHVSVLYPPDTQTEGFDEENKTKPEECKMMSEGGGLMTAAQVASFLIRNIKRKKFDILPGQAGFLRFMFRLSPCLVRNIIDSQYKTARKKLGKDH